MKRVFTLACIAVASSSFAPPPIGTADTFSDLTLMGWGGGASPTVVASGGPAGTGDPFLQITGAGGIGGIGAVPATFNTVQWTGDYSAAGVKAVSIDFKNFSGSVPLSMRSVFIGAGGTRYSSNYFHQIPANSGWQRVYFPIRQDLFTNVTGAETWAQVMSACSNYHIRNATTNGSGGTPAAATLGMDNITPLASIPIVPTAIEITSGTFFGGDLNSVRMSDNDHYFILCDEATPKGGLLVTANPSGVPNATYSALQYRIEHSATRADLVLFIALKNYTTNTYVTVNNVVTSLTDTVVSGQSNLGANVIGSNPVRVEARLQWFPQEDLVAEDGWSMKIDEVHWEIVP